MDSERDQGLLGEEGSSKGEGPREERGSPSKKGNKLSPPKSLKKRREFSRVLRKGFRFNYRGLSVYVYPKESGNLRLSVVVPKKVEKSSVKRNRLKRIVKEYFRINVKPEVDGCDVVVLARSIEIKKLGDMNGELLERIKKATCKVS